MCAQQRRVDCPIGAIHKLDRRRVLLTTRSIGRSKKFLSRNFRSPKSLEANFQRELSLFLEVPEFPYNTVYDIMSTEAPMPNPARFLHPFR